jgi:sugar lactone lactonase YvrE
MKHSFLKITAFIIVSGFYSCNKDPRYTTPPPTYVYNVIDGPDGLVIDKTGNIYFTNSVDFNILKVSTSGKISSIAGSDTVPGCSGDGGPATSAHFTDPEAIALDAAGNIYFSDTYCERIYKITISTGIMSLVAGNGISGSNGDGGLATSAQLYNSIGIALDTSGNIYIADNGNYKIRMVNAKTGIISTIAGTSKSGFSGDGGPATAAELSKPGGVAVDDSGNVYIADLDNSRIRKVIASTGIISTIVSGVEVGSMVLDSSRNIYFVGSHKVYELNNKTKVVSTIAGNGKSGNSGDGGPATSAELCGPDGVALDGAGNVYISDFSNNNIRKVTVSTGIITTVAHN